MIEVIRYALWMSVPFVVFANFEWFDNAARRKGLLIATAMLSAVAIALSLISSDLRYLFLLIPAAQIVIVVFALVSFRKATHRQLDNNIYTGALQAKRIPDRVVNVLMWLAILFIGAITLRLH